MFRVTADEPSFRSAGYEVFRAAEEVESVIGRIVSAQREELEIGDLDVEAERVAEEARELAGEVPFCKVGNSICRLSLKSGRVFP